MIAMTREMTNGASNLDGVFKHPFFRRFIIRLDKRLMTDLAHGRIFKRNRRDLFTLDHFFLHLFLEKRYTWLINTPPESQKMYSFLGNPLVLVQKSNRISKCTNLWIQVSLTSLWFFDSFGNASPYELSSLLVLHPISLFEAHTADTGDPGHHRANTQHVSAS